MRRCHCGRKFFTRSGLAWHEAWDTLWGAPPLTHGEYKESAVSLHSTAETSSPFVSPIGGAER